MNLLQTSTESAAKLNQASEDHKFNVQAARPANQTVGLRNHNNIKFKSSYDRKQSLTTVAAAVATASDKSPAEETVI